jgi:small nuclear ribonucleoprotein (snRNP)-like protein
MKIDFNVFDNKSVIVKTVSGDRFEGILHLHHMNYPDRLIFEIDQKFFEEFQIRGIQEIKMR